MMVLVRQLVLLLLHCNIVITSFHIFARNNQLADSISRLKINQENAVLHGLKSSRTHSSRITPKELDIMISSHLHKSKAKSTLCQYNSVWMAVQSFMMCTLGIPVILPLSVLTIVFHNIRPETLKSHLSAISFVHHIRDLPDPTGSYFIRSILWGMQKVMPKRPLKRPIDVTLLIKLINSLNGPNLSVYYKSLLTVVMTWLYFGCFRVGVLLISATDDHTLLYDNVRVKILNGSVDSYKAHLPSYKFSRGRSATIILTRKSPDTICPVRAMNIFLSLRAAECRYMFVFPDGKPCTRKWFAGNSLYLNLLGID